MESSAPPPGFNFLGGPVSVGVGTAGLGDDHHQGPQQRQEEDDQRVAADFLPHDAKERVHRADDVPARVDQRARKNAQQQRGDNLLGQQDQDDGDDRRQNRQPAKIHGNTPMHKIKDVP